MAHYWREKCPVCKRKTVHHAVTTGKECFGCMTITPHQQKLSFIQKIFKKEDKTHGAFMR